MEIKNEEKIELKNGKIAYLFFSKTENGVYAIQAFKDDKRMVGKCYFEIACTLSRAVDNETRLKIAKIQNVPLEKVSNCEKITESYEHYKENQDKFKNYILEDVFCNLSNIEVLEDDFHNVGLGTVMCQKMEKFAIENGCKYISGFYLPIGIFPESAMGFYKRNGFTFQKERIGTYVYKDLVKEASHEKPCDKPREK